MQVIGLCRFSYPAIGGFQVEHETIEDRIAYLYGEARLEERFRLMEAVALPCIKAQTDGDFELIVVIGDQLPKMHRDRLHDITANIPQIRIHEEPPRPQREVMKEILNKARKDPSQPCLQFRHDDDDAFAVDFIERLRAASHDAERITAQHKAVNFDWNKGMVAEFGADGIATTDIFRQLYPAAMGMQIRGNSPLTIMNFAHEKIARFMPVISYAEPQMFVRSHNSSNDSRQKPVKKVPVAPIDYEKAQMLKERFAIDIDQIQSLFGGA
ncbi:putative rhamnosyl transferase [Sulfitobacter sp. HNIBRBA2951]|uniref:putative rhamnosyl transferase n=1 Tax=Sulfitobacter aquimarinus TaxID=3158557 RepID=UPI0032DE4D3A